MRLRLRDSKYAIKVSGSQLRMCLRISVSLNPDMTINTQGDKPPPWKKMMGFGWVMPVTGDSFST